VQLNNRDEAELSLREFLGVLNSWKWGILVFVSGCVAIAAATAHFMPRKYDGITLLSPVSNTSTNGLLGGLNSMVSQFGGLASLAGVSESATDTNKAETIAVLESEALTEQYIRDNNLLPVLYSDEWDAGRRQWKTTDRSKIPTLWTANVLFKKKIRSVTVDAKSGLVTLRIRWKDPVQAAQWANDLVRMTNAFRRDKAISESDRNIAYLTTEAAKTDAIGVKQAVYSVLQTELSKAMLAKGNDEYALKVLDPAVVPERPASPPPMYIVLIVAFFVSLGLALGTAFVWTALREPAAK
jgi:uncharacterized protein involved in exopolysaccharide biosynthesis